MKLKLVAGKHHTLEHELHVYKKLSGGIGMPSVHWFGIEGCFNVMAIDRLGPSLEDLFVRCHFQFTVRTVLLLAHQLVSQLSRLMTTELTLLCQGLSPAIHPLSQLLTPVFDTPPQVSMDSSWSPRGVLTVLMESSWSPHGVHVESSWSARGVYEESSQSPHRVHGVLIDSS